MLKMKNDVPEAFMARLMSKKTVMLCFLSKNIILFSQHSENLCVHDCYVNIASQKIASMASLMERQKARFQTISYPFTIFLNKKTFVYRTNYNICTHNSGEIFSREKKKLEFCYNNRSWFMA